MTHLCAALRCRVHDVVHFDLLDHVHKRGKAADEHSGEPKSADQPFSPAMLAKVHTIVPLVWRWGLGSGGRGCEACRHMPAADF